MKESKWFNQSLLTFKDEQYSSDGKLSLYISTNTDNFLHFNSPSFGISVTNERHKNCILNIQNAEDLLESINTSIKQVNGTDIIIEKNYNKKVKLYFRFAIVTSTNERVVIIELISNENDTTKIIIPLKPIFQSFMRRLKSFVNNYDNICYKLMIETLNGESKQIIERIPTLIKGISLQIAPQEINYENYEKDEIDLNNYDEDLIKKTEFDISDLDSFIGDNMENIKIDEIENKKIEPIEKPIEIDSPFTTKILKNDLINFENKLILYSRSENSINEMLTDLEGKLNFKLLNGITDDQMKTVIYISTLYKQFYTESYLSNQSAIPEHAPSLKFIGDNNPQNVEFAKDIFMFTCYYRAIKRKLELKETDVFINKSMIYFLIRNIMDIVSISYLENITPNEILSSIKNRYIYFDKLGVFDKYKIILSDYNCTDIKLTEIYSLAEDYLKSREMSNNNKNPIEQLYNTLDLTLPMNNEYNTEQILKEVIPLEVSRYFGNDLSNIEIINKLKEKYNISDEIIELFSKKPKEKTKTNIIITPLERWVKQFQQDIPEAYQNEVLEYVKNMKYETFDFETSSWPLDEFDDRIIKALYTWNVKSNPKIKGDFREFASLVENEIMTKEAILLTNRKKETSEEMENWNSIENLI